MARTTRVMLSNFNLDLAAELNSVQISNPTTLQPELRNCGTELISSGSHKLRVHQNG